MRKHLKRNMNNSDLEQMDGSYEGVIVEVTLEEMWNRHRGKREEHPIITFEDGWRIVPNIGMRRDLVDGFGPESEDWIGSRVRIFLRPMARKDTSGKERRFEKAVECLDSRAVTPQTTASEMVTAAEISWE